MDFLKTIFAICILRGRAQDLPASQGLMVLIAAIGVVVNSAGLSGPSFGSAHVLFIVMQTALFGAAVWTLLRLRGFPARWLQTMTALYAVDAIFSMLLLPVLPALVEMVKQGAQAQLGWEGVALLFLSGWLLLIIARVLREATEWPLPLAFLAGLTVLLAVRMVGHMLVPLFGLSPPA